MMDRTAQKKKKNAGIGSGKDTDLDDLRRHFQSKYGFISLHMCHIIDQKKITLLDFRELGIDSTRPVPGYTWMKEISKQVSEAAKSHKKGRLCPVQHSAWLGSYWKGAAKKPVSKAQC